MSSRLHSLALIVCLASITPLSAQTQTWTSAANIVWDNPANWTPTGVPDTASESARFDRFGTYNAALSDAAPTPIKDLTIERGEIRLLSAGFDIATLQVTGDTLVQGELELENASVETTGNLSLTTGAFVTAAGVNVSAGSTTIAGGSLTEATVLLLDDGVIADFGDTLVADTGGLANRGGIDLFKGTAATMRNLHLAIGTPEAIGEVNVSASTLTQTAGGTAIIGRAAPLDGSSCGTRCGTLAVSEGGLLNLESLLVNETGTLFNLRSQVTIANSLTIDGGVYEERFEATRTLGPNASVVVRGAGQLILSNSPLTLSVGQGLSLEDNAVVQGQSVAADGGTVTVEAGSDVRFADGFDNLSDTLTIEAGAVATFAGGYGGAGASGPGMARFEGAVSPGQSPGEAAFEGDILWTTGAEFIAQIGGSSLGQYDTIAAAGSATLGGGLVVELIDAEPTNDGLFIPQPGDSYTLLTAGGINGSFETVTTPDLQEGFAWRLDQRPTSLTLRVVEETGLTGDFNGDGSVDAADYTLWRDTVGSAGPLLSADANGDQAVDGADLAAWRAGYGSLVGTTAIPEPSTALLFAATLALLPQKKLVQRPQRP